MLKIIINQILLTKKTICRDVIDNFYLKNKCVDYNFVKLTKKINEFFKLMFDNEMNISIVILPAHNEA